MFGKKMRKRERRHPRPDTIVGFAAVGHTGSSAGEVKLRVRAQGYPTPNDTGLTYGGGGYIWRGRLLNGGIGSGGGARSANENQTTAYGEGGGGSLLGYAAYENARLRVYPYIGVGGVGEGIRVERRNQAVAHRLKEADIVRIGTGEPALQCGVGVEYRLPLNRSLALMLGIQAGILIRPLRRAWEGSAVGETALPRPPLVRPQFHLLFGFVARPRR